MKNHYVLRTGHMDEQSNYDSGETASPRESSRTTKGGILRSLPVFFRVHRVSRGFRQKKIVLRPLSQLPQNSWYRPLFPYFLSYFGEP